MRAKSVVFMGIIIMSLFILESCSDKWEKYTIKAGDHSTNKISSPLVGVDEIDFEFKTNGTWYYAPPPGPGWNKIRGLSHGHHQNNSSARLGYQCLNDTLLIVGAYCYVDGVSPQQNTSQKGIIDTVEVNKKYHCKIKMEAGKYKFYFEDKYWEGPAGEDKSWGYLLNPYIGGSFTLPHDWFVEIKDN